MRFFCYLNTSTNQIDVVSDEEIYKNYYALWKIKILQNLGLERLKDLVFDDCLDDWITIHNAWESLD